MDPSLLRERELFKQRAYALPVIEKKKRPVEDDEDLSRKSMPIKSPVVRQAPPSSQSKDLMNYKSLAGTSQYNFSVLTRIVKYMKQRYLDGDNEPLTLDEILDETNQLDIGSRQRHWLETEALTNNPKIVRNEENKYIYKPTYPLKDRKSLLRLLDRHDQRGLGGILLEDIQESLPNADRILKNIADSVIIITRPNDKKKIVYYNDKNMQFKVDEEFQKLWRSVAVEGLDEGKIEEYLQKHGIASMANLEMKKGNAIQKRKKPTSKKPRSFKKHNEHMGDILEDYSAK